MKKSLAQLLDAFHVPENLDEFDPEKHIGDIKDKVDSIRWRLTLWETEAKMIQEEWINELERKKRSILAARDRLKEYTLKQMLLAGFEELPGNMMRVKVQESAPSLEIEHAPKAQDFMAFPKYVKQEITYTWLKDTIKEDAEGDVLPVPGMALKRGKHIRFYPVKEPKV